MKPEGTLFLKRSEIVPLLTFAEYVAIVEDAFRGHSEGRSLPPALMHVDADGGEFHIKAGGLRGDRAYFAVKINGGFFQNRARFDMPNIQGVILLSDAQNGYPLCLMDSVEITIQRTGAATAVAAKYLARPESSVCTVCGVGNQGRIQLRALVATLPIRVAWAWSRSPGKAELFAHSMSAELGIDVRASSDLESAALQSDAIVTCTPSRTPFLFRKAIRPGTFIAAVGADSPDKQELEAELVAAASVFGDIPEQIVNVGETHHAIEKGLFTAGQIRGGIGEVITGRKPGRQSENEITLFDSTGTALQDVAAAIAVYKKARGTLKGKLIDLAS